MNANELADINEWSCCAHSKEVSAMLRQQQAKLEKSQALLREYTALNMRQQTEIESLKAKTLTDEEIYLLAEEYNLKWSGYMDLVIRFAKAILRKAQEK